MKLNEINLSLDETVGLMNYYGNCSKFTSLPKGYEYGVVAGSYEEAKTFDKYLRSDGTVANVNALETWDGLGRYYVITLVQIPVKYRFICDDDTPRKPKIGDWVPYWGINRLDQEGQYEYRANRFVWVTQEFIDDCGDNPTLIHRREEIID